MNNLERRQHQMEKERDVPEPVITQADPDHITAERGVASIESLDDNDYDVRRLEKEERRSIPQSAEERRQRMQQRIIDNAVLESPHRHYFVREPGR